MEVKKTSLHFYIIKFVFKIGISFLSILLISFIIFNYLLNFGILLPANYSEQLIKNSKKQIISAEKVTTQLIPKTLRYVILNKENFKIVSTNMKQNKIEIAKEIVKNNKYNKQGTDVYYIIERPKEYCVIYYKLIVQFANPILRRLVPYPGITGIGLLVILLLVTLYVLTFKFSNKMKEELNKFSLVTEKIEKQDLDFEIQKVSFEEYQKVMNSLDNLRLSLKKSLVTQFEEEKNKREQISALAHDIKIPLTIIKGNGELLSITQKDKNALDYTNEIIDATNQIQKYIQLLVDVSQNDNIVNVCRQKQNVNEFINVIEKNTFSSIGKRNIHFKLNNNLPKNIIWSVDLQSMERAFMNIIINAIENTPEQKSLSFEVLLKSNFVYFIITDEGEGFSNEAIKKAKEMFYTSDKSRSQIGHYGIGLAFADKVIRAHNGNLNIQNDSNTGGGQVLVSLPIKIEKF